MGNLSSQTKIQIKGIVRFKIKIQEEQATYKLSQNRNEADYHNIIEKLSAEDSINSKSLVHIAFV